MNVHDVVVIEWTGIGAQVTYVVPKGDEAEFMRRFNEHGNWRVSDTHAIYLPRGD